MNCPVDHVELQEHEYESEVMVDVCPECQGVWLDRGELERVQEAIENDHSTELSAIPDTAIRAYAKARQQAQPARACPCCGLPMERSEYGFCSQIMIDRCDDCSGVWLDGGELGALETFFERSRIESAEIRRGFFASLVDQLIWR